MKTVRINNPFIKPIPDYYRITFENNGRRAVIKYFDNTKDKMAEPTEKDIVIDEQVFWFRYEQAYDLDQLSNMRGSADAQVWQFVELGAGVVRPAALFELTVNRRSQPEVLNAVNGSIAGTSLVVPFSESAADEVTLVINCSEMTTVEIVNGAEPALSNFTRAYDLWFSLLPSVELTLHSVTDGTHRVDVQVTPPAGMSNRPAEVYLDLVGGVLLTQRVKTDVNGKGSAYLSLQGLPSGYESRLKAGFKFTTSLGELALIKD